MNEVENLVEVANNVEMRKAAFYSFLLFFVFPVVSIFFLTSRKSKEEDEKKDYENFKLSDSVKNKFKAKYPGITDLEVDLVWRALKSFLDLVAQDSHERNSGIFFKFKSKKKAKVFSMTSVIVDDLWHEFILDTRNYMNYCNKFCGGYIHHHPGTVKFETDFRNKRVEDEVIATFLALLENMDDKNHINSIPLMFVVDEYLELNGGFRFNYKNICQQANEKNLEIEKREILEAN